MKTLLSYFLPHRSFRPSMFVPKGCPPNVDTANNARTILWSVIYLLVLTGFHFVYSSYFFNVGFAGKRAVVWSLTAIPFISFTLHMGLLRISPLPIFLLLLLLDGLVDAAVATHWSYFGYAPSIRSLISSINEVTTGAFQSGGFIPRGLLPLLIAKAFTLALLAWHIRPRLRWNLLLKQLAVAAALLLVAFIIRHPAEAARPYAYEICIKTHGTYTAAISELAFHNSLTALDPSLATTPPAPLSPECVDKVPRQFLDSILAIQVESLDWEILGYEFHGQVAAPFLTSLGKSSLLFRINPHHSSVAGSSGADFQFLTSAFPPFHSNGYRDRELETLPSLPRFLREHGMRTVAMHGNTASFWGREKGYARLGISEFIEKKNYNIVDGGWGVSDRTFFEQNKQTIEASSKPTLFFMITLSSHAPFRWVQDKVFPASGMDGDYLNSMHYTDRCIGDFLRGIRGKHLVVLYGDHASNVEGEIYRSKPLGKEYVPGMVVLLDNGQFIKPSASCTREDLQSGRYDIRSLGNLVRKITSEGRRP